MITLVQLEPQTLTPFIRKRLHWICNPKFFISVRVKSEKYGAFKLDLGIILGYG